MTGIGSKSRLTVAVASGKGGTGKTLVSTNLALAAARAGAPVALVDCDAEAPNDALFLDPFDAETVPVEVPIPEVDQSSCLLCGACRTACAYGAIRIIGGAVLVFPELCHNCGACITACTPGALREVTQRVGEVEWGRTDRTLSGPAGLSVFTGRLDVGEVKTPTVIRAARRRAGVANPAVTILDAPPGVACSAVAAVRGADVLVLVTEPTPFGLHDLKRAVALGRQLGIPMGVVVNRSGLVEDDGGLEEYCRLETLPVIARIPFDRDIAAVYAGGGLIIDRHPGAATLFAALWESVRQLAEEGA